MSDEHRRLRQQLESLSLAGLRFLPRGAPPQGIRLPVSAMPAVPVRTPDPASSLQPAKAFMAQPEAVASEKTLFRKSVDQPRATSQGGPTSESVPHARASQSADSLTKRVQALAILNDKVKGCTRCKELSDTRTQTVFGVGNPQTRVLFIGEAPGADEDAQGEPFVGRAGQLLNQIIAALRLKREEIYICNILKCRPPGNRAPAEDECANCREYLDGQLAAIDPDYIVCWGAVAAQNLLRSTLSIGKMRGKFLQHGRARVLCTYHPSYLLRNPAAKKDVWQDMQFLMADMGVDLTSKP